MMRRNIITFSLEIIVMLIFLQHRLVASLSHTQQKNALFQFKQSLTIGPPGYCYSQNTFLDFYEILSDDPKTRKWSMSSEYCTWEGVSCDYMTGDIIGLDLSCSQLEGAILPNSTLFQLSHLQFLDLSNNNFSLSNQFPQELGFFAKGLTHLNLSYTQFKGQVPSGISHLHKLVSLDVGYNPGAILENEVFKSLFQNLSQLRVLNLALVNIFSVLPTNLSSSLKVVNLGYTGLYGELPQEVFHLPNLEVLELSINRNLSGILPEVKWGSSNTLQHLHLRGINFQYGSIPDSIGFLDSLATLSLSECNLSGPIPKSIGNLSQLTYLGLRFNDLNGPILTLLTNLTDLLTLSLDSNSFTGPIPSAFVAHSIKLIEMDLSYNGFTGPLPPGLFTGQLRDFDSSKSQLKSFDCSNNLFFGHIPQSFSQLVNLTYLDFSSNNFSGVLDIEMFSSFENLSLLDLSHNSLTVRSTSMAILPSKLFQLGLSSCNMKEFPHFSRDANITLNWVDLSNNEIDGKIPHWIGSVRRYLNISRNRLTGGLEQINWNDIRYLDLQSNRLNESLPALICNSTSLEVLNLSHNNLSGILPSCRTNLTRISVFDLQMNKIQGSLPPNLSNFRNLKSINLHGNKLEGIVPSSFSEFDKLETFDLGSNQINDTFPECLEALPNLQVLVLKSNKFHGLISKISKIEHPFPSLRIIDLSYNEFSGPLPAIYFENFKAMMNGDVNKIERSYMGDNFYYHDSTNLVIKGNEIELDRILTVFTTIDVSKNNFEGEIAEYIGNLVSLRFLNLSHNLLIGHIPPSIGKLTLLESLDLSSNQLKGEIPQQLTDLYSLAILNLSCNQLTGHIPQGSQFNTFENNSFVGNLGLCGNPLSKKCVHDNVTQEKGTDEDHGYFFSGFTWKAVVIGYGCGVVPAFIIGNLMLLAGKPKWFAGIIARELGLKIRRMEIRMR